MSKREAEMKKEEKKIYIEAQAWEKLIGYQAGPFL